MWRRRKEKGQESKVQESGDGRLGVGGYEMYQVGAVHDRFVL